MAEFQQPAAVGQDETFLVRVDRYIYKFACHWLLILNTVAFFFATLPFVAAFTAAQGYTTIANSIYSTFGLICHQLPDHSFTVFGEQVAYCQRDTAIYSTAFVAGLGYAIVRDRLSPIGYKGVLLLAFPMALDGFTQLFGLRESTWELRLITGSLFAFGVLWFALPRLDQGFAEIRNVVEKRFDRLVRQGRSRPLEND